MFLKLIFMLIYPFILFIPLFMEYLCTKMQTVQNLGVELLEFISIVGMIAGFVSLIGIVEIETYLIESVDMILNTDNTLRVKTKRLYNKVIDKNDIIIRQNTNNNGEIDAECKYVTRTEERLKRMYIDCEKIIKKDIFNIYKNVIYCKLYKLLYITNTYYKSFYKEDVSSNINHTIT